MTGIAGWYDDGGKPDSPDALANKMVGALPCPGDTTSRHSTRGSVCGRVSDDRSYASVSSDTVCVMAGSPRWQCRTLAGVAKTKGHGQALYSAYRKHGLDLFDVLFGSFAFAIVDARTSNTMLAVDRIGIEPLCYANSRDGGLVFGSTTSAILAHGKVNANVSPQALYNYIYFHVIPSPRTVFEDIQKLEPGQFIHFANGELDHQFYWQPEPRNRSQDTDQADLQSDLMATMRSAIHKSASNDKTGAFLSGGLDSSTVCGMASESLEKPLHAYSIGFDQQGYDEIEYARAAAHHFGMDLREYYVTPDDVADAIPVIASNYDEPFGNASAVPTYYCARLAKDDGVDRLLAGDGGDELFAGNERYATQTLFQYYERIPAILRKLAIEPAATVLPMQLLKFTHKVRRYVEQAKVAMPERMQSYNYLHMNEPSSVFEPTFLRAVDTHSPVSELEDWYSRTDGYDFLDRMLFLDWKLTLADNDLRKVNRMCSAAGVQVEYPLLDDELVEFSTRVPSHLKMRHRDLRHFFRTSVSSFLPEKVLTKHKHGFGLPIGEWLKSNERLRDIAMPMLDDLSDRGIVQRGFVDRLQREHSDVHAAYFGNMIWVLVMLECWLQSRAIGISFSG